MNLKKNTSPRRTQRPRRFFMGLHADGYSPAAWQGFLEQPTVFLRALRVLRGEVSF